MCVCVFFLCIFFSAFLGVKATQRVLGSGALAQGSSSLEPLLEILDAWKLPSGIWY